MCCGVELTRRRLGPQHSLATTPLCGTPSGGGLGKQLMQHAFAAICPAATRIGAQSYLEKFYRDLGFVPALEPYIEVGIPHLEMLRAPAGDGNRRFHLEHVI